MHEPQPSLVKERTEEDDPPCNDIVPTAEHEFMIFTRVVAELFGPVQATLSAEDWLNEVASRPSLPEPRSREWRLITVAALARLTIRTTVDLQDSIAALCFR